MKIGFVSDIHEDINSLKEALRILDFQKCDKIVCLGDIVGYSVPFYGFLSSRNASEVIELLKKKCDIIVAGNHDLFAIRKLPKYKAGFKYPKNWYTLILYIFFVCSPYSVSPLQKTKQKGKV